MAGLFASASASISGNVIGLPAKSASKTIEYISPPASSVSAVHRRNPLREVFLLQLAVAKVRGERSDSKNLKVGRVRLRWRSVSVSLNQGTENRRCLKRVECRRFGLDRRRSN